MDDISTDSEVELTIDESVTTKKINRKNAKKKTKKQIDSIADNKPIMKKHNVKLKIQITEPKSVRVSNRTRKPKQLSPLPPIQNIKLKIKKSIKKKIVQKRNAKAKTDEITDNIPEENIDLSIQNSQIDIESISGDGDEFTVSCLPMPTKQNNLKDAKKLPSKMNKKKGSLKIRLSLGKVLPPVVNNDTKKPKKSGTEKLNPKILQKKKLKMVQPIKIKRTQDIFSKPLDKEGAPKISQVTSTHKVSDHEPLKLKFSAGKKESDDLKQSNLQWTVSSKCKVQQNTKEFGLNSAGSSHHFVQKLPDKTTFSSKPVQKEKNMEIKDTSSSDFPTTLTISSSSILKQSNLNNEKSSVPQNPLLNLNFQSLLDTVTAELKEQEKHKEETVETNNLSDLGEDFDYQNTHLPTVEFPKQELKFSHQSKRPRKKSSAGVSHSLLKLKESVDVLKPSELPLLQQSEYFNELPEKDKRKILKRKDLTEDYVDPDTVPGCMPDAKRIKTSSKEEISSDVPSKGFNSLLMPSYWTEPTDFKSKLTKSFNTVNLQDKKPTVTKRNKKGMTTTKQRLASKLKLGTKRRFVF